MFPGTHRRIGSVARAELLDQILGGIEREARRIICGVGRRPQQVALLVVLPAVSLPDETVRRLHDQMRRRNQPVGHVLGKPGKTGGTAVVHVHADGANRRHVRPTAMKGGLAAVAIDQLTQRVDTEVDITAAAHVEQLRAVRRRAGRCAGRVQRDQLAEQAATALVLRHNLLEPPELVMHARLTGAGMNLPRKTHHVARLKERLHEAERATLEAVLDIGIESGGSRHREIQAQPERTAREKPRLADENGNDEGPGRLLETLIEPYRFFWGVGPGSVERSLYTGRSCCAGSLQ